MTDMKTLTTAEDHTRNCSAKDLDTISKTPKGREEAELMVCGTPGLETGRHEDMDSNSQPVNYPGLHQLQFDNRGMLLPHSILGCLEDFRSYLEATCETDVKRIPKSVGDPLSEITGRHCSETVRGRNVPGHRNRGTNALLHWDTHMEQRRRQQNQLSELLDSPVEKLLMNKANHYRETQEEKEILNQALPLIQPGYGHRVGSEFWSFPQRYGDELSGITATLTQTELGRRRAVTHVGQPNRVRQESGLLHDDTSRPVSQTRGQRLYLQHQMEELRELLSDIRKPEINRLEVLGSGKPFTSIPVCQCPSMEMEEKQKELKDENEANIDSLTDDHDVQSDAVCGPALRFCGQLATWTGNSVMKQGEVAISSTLIFETLTGEAATSHLELHNEGITAVHFNWLKLPMKHSFRVLPEHSMKPHFFFNSSPGVICPGDTHQVDFIFRPEAPGIEAECWQLNTHPVLLQGASIQVTLRGVALPQDQTADQRRFIENKLEKAVVVKMCQSIVEEVILGVHSPERPSSPEERYTTEEQKFLIKNLKLQFVHEPVQNLKRLWQEVSPGPSWDMSVDTLRQAVLSVPEEEPTEGCLTREEGLARMNSLLLQLSESSGLKRRHLPASTVGQQLMKTLLEGMAEEATQLRNLLGLPLSETWAGRSDQSSDSDSVLSDTSKDEESKRRGARATFKDNKQKSKSSIAERSFEETKRQGKRRNKVGKSSKAKPENDSLVDAPSEDISKQAPDVNPGKLIYTRLLHKKVYDLMEDFVDSLCDLADEVNSGDEAEAHQLNELTYEALAPFM